MQHEDRNRAIVTRSKPYAHERNQDRDFRLALRPLARCFLPGEPAAAARARIRIARTIVYRDQRLLLFPAAASKLGRLVPRYAGRLHLQRQGPALYHAYPPPARGGEAARQLPRVGSARPAGETGPYPVAVPAQFSLRRAASRAVLHAAAARYGPSAGAGPPARPAYARALAAGHRPRAQAAACHRDTP